MENYGVNDSHWEHLEKKQLNNKRKGKYFKDNMETEWGMFLETE